jgi:hypothetical protein
MRVTGQESKIVSAETIVARQHDTAGQGRT